MVTKMMMIKLSHCLYTSKICGYIKSFDETEHMFFLIKNDELVTKNNEICDKMRNSNKNGFKNELIYNKKYLKTNPKSYRCKSKKNTFLKMEYLNMVLIVFFFQ